MAALTWIISLLCAAAAALLSSASPAPRSAQVAQVVQVGQSVSLSCNFTSSRKLTWYLLRSDQLLPLLSVVSQKVRNDSVIYEEADSGRVYSKGSLTNGEVVLEILQVKEEDAGIYFCSWEHDGKILVNRGIHLSVQKSSGPESGETAGLPCWSLGICVLPALLISCVVFIVGLFVYSGTPASACCCRGNNSQKTTEDTTLHYSSLRHADQLQPSGRGGRGGPGGRGGGRGGRGGGTGLVKEEVVYSTVAGRKTPHGSHDC